MTFEALAQSIRARRRPGGDRCLVVGVDGLSGAGKTSFAARLSAELSAPCVSADGLVPGWDGLEASLGTLVVSILEPLARGEAGRWRRFDWVENRPAEWIDVPTCDVLVIEGCCVGVPPVAAYLSYLVWIETPADDRRRRLQEREDWVHYAPHFDRWSQQESALQAGAGTPDRADLVVDNSGPACGETWGAGFVSR
jgi:uridine kinase